MLEERKEFNECFHKIPEIKEIANFFEDKIDQIKKLPQIILCKESERYNDVTGPNPIFWTYTIKYNGEELSFYRFKSFVETFIKFSKIEMEKIKNDNQMD